jgi:hypothetical protein
MINKKARKAFAALWLAVVTFIASLALAGLVLAPAGNIDGTVAVLVATPAFCGGFFLVAVATNWKTGEKVSQLYRWIVRMVVVIGGIVYAVALTLNNGVGLWTAVIGAGVAAVLAVVIDLLA